MNPGTSSDDGAKAFVIGVAFVVVGRRMRFEFIRELLEDGGEDGIDGGLVTSISIPDRDEMAGESDGEGDATDVIP